MRWENATVVDTRRKRGFAICLEAGWQLRIFPQHKSGKSLNYAPLGGVSRIPQPCPEESDSFLSFFPTRLSRYLKMKRKRLPSAAASAPPKGLWGPQGEQWVQLQQIPQQLDGGELFTNSSQKQQVSWLLWFFFLSGGSLNESQFCLSERRDVKAATADSGSDSSVY